MNSNRTLKWLASLVSGVFVLTLAAVVTRWISTTVKSDPLVKYKSKNPDDVPENVAVLSLDTVFRRVESGVPKASCFVKKMTIARNRQVYDFDTIQRGSIEWKGEKYGFEGGRGQWNGFNKVLEVTDGVKLVSSKLNLKSDQLFYNETLRTLEITTPVTGIAYQGKIKVTSFKYFLDKQEFEAGPGEWIGVPPKELLPEELNVQAGDEPPRKWDFKYQKISKKAGLIYYDQCRAQDDDVIVKAPKMTWDEKQDVLVATGRVQYFGRDSNLIADKVTIYRKEKRSVFSGNVTMMVKPKEDDPKPPVETEIAVLPPASAGAVSATRPPLTDRKDPKMTEDEVRSAKNLRKYPLSLSASEIIYFYKKGERRAEISGTPQARQEIADEGWRYAWAFKATYDVEKDRLDLFSQNSKKDVIVKNSLGDIFNAGRGWLSTKEDDDEYEFWDGDGTVTTRDEDLPKKDPPKTNTDKTGRGGGLARV